MEERKDQLAYAIKLASCFHVKHQDKNGEAYILHPLRVMFQMETYDEKVVAVLHDVIEDCDGVCLETLQQLGIEDKYLESIDAISRREKESYIDYIHRVEKNTIAKKVKIADLVDNLSRKGANVSLRYRYVQALSILTGEDYPSKRVIIAEFYGMQVYVDLLWPEMEGLCVNYQDEKKFIFRLDKEEFHQKDECKYIETVFMEWYMEYKEKIFEMITNLEFYRLPEWEE